MWSRSRSRDLARALPGTARRASASTEIANSLSLVMAVEHTPCAKVTQPDAGALVPAAAGAAVVRETGGGAVAAGPGPGSVRAGAVGPARVAGAAEHCRGGVVGPA